ncbi:helix-turn-helix domain-containing protein [Streptomonospora litoralis]|uniref:helix-turn-helix domain-containing protein n=1 Tax=Streptomonospora litoralis TaxID=2498135 RepID=UPI00103654EB|nr:helix-turn-helix transcriptional regulator [Streptomonospora litoralis]
MTDTQFGNIVRRAMDVRGWSLRELARQVHYDAGYLSRVISGKKRPSAELAQLLDEALGAEGALIQLGTAVAPDREHLPHTRPTPSRVDTETVASFATVLAAQRRLDDAVGSAAVLAPTLAQLENVEPLAHQG